jgi:N-acetylglucosamine-6-phosphate deacetylase
MLESVVGGRVLMPDRSLRSCDVVIDGGRIQGLVAQGTRAKGEQEVLDASGCVVSPGFIDTHVHGAGGFNFMDLDEGVSTVARHLGDLAGGTKGLAGCVRDLVRAGALPVADALACASATPARSVGVEDAKGRRLPGHDADLVAPDPDLQLRATVHAGSVAHLHPECPHTRRQRRPA